MSSMMIVILSLGLVINLQLFRKLVIDYNGLVIDYIHAGNHFSKVISSVIDYRSYVIDYTDSRSFVIDYTNLVIDYVKAQNARTCFMNNVINYITLVIDYAATGSP